MQLLGLAIVLFASTNVDDVFVLVGFFNDPGFKPREVVIGQYGGIATLFAVSVLGSLMSLVIPRAYIGFFGIVAIGLGAKKIFDLFLNRDQQDRNLDREQAVLWHTRIATVAFVTVANGADNIGIYTPAFAIHSGSEIAVFAVVFALLTGLWCYFAHWMIHHPRFGKPLRRYGHLLAPLVLIGIGVSVMYQAGSLSLLFHGLH